MVTAAAPADAWHMSAQRVRGGIDEAYPLHQRASAAKRARDKARTVQRVLLFYAAPEHLCICSNKCSSGEKRLTEKPGPPLRQNCRAPGIPGRHSGQAPRATEQEHAEMSLGNAHAKRLPEAIPASLDLPTLQEGCMRAAPGRPKGPEKNRRAFLPLSSATAAQRRSFAECRKSPGNAPEAAHPAFPLTPLNEKNVLRQPAIQKQLRLGSSLGFTHALLEALCAAMTATVQFFLTFDFLMSHNSLRGKPH